jgi:hypothetical protein
MCGQVDDARGMGTVALLLGADDSTSSLFSSSLLSTFPPEACCSFITPVNSVKASLESLAATSFYRRGGGPDERKIRLTERTHSLSEIIFALAILEFIFRRTVQHADGLSGIG